MRFWTAALSLFAASAIAQTSSSCNNYNCVTVPAGQSTLDITAGIEQTITWANPSGGTVTIKLQQSDSQITPNSGIVLATNVPASAKTATFTIDPTKVNSFQYTIEIIDDSNPSVYNFSPNFGIKGAEATGSATTGTASATSGSSSSATGSSGSRTSSSAATTSGSSSSASASASNTSSSSDSSSASSTSSAAAETTSAPSSGDAAAMRAPGSLLALAVGVFALL